MLSRNRAGWSINGGASVIFSKLVRQMIKMWDPEKLEYVHSSLHFHHDTSLFTLTRDHQVEKHFIHFNICPPIAFSENEGGGLGLNFLTLTQK